MKIKLFEDLKSCKGNRKNYRIKPFFKFYADKNYLYSFFPTIIWTPWVYRHPNTEAVVDIWWLNLHILIGKWEVLSCNYCKHCYECINNKKRKSYFDDILKEGKKCSKFETRQE